MELQKNALMTLVPNNHGYDIIIHYDDRCDEERIHCVHPSHQGRLHILDDAQAMMAVLIDGLYEQGYGVHLVDTITFYSLYQGDTLLLSPCFQPSRATP